MLLYLITAIEAMRFVVMPAVKQTLSKIEHLLIRHPFGFEEEILYFSDSIYLLQDS